MKNISFNEKWALLRGVKSVDFAVAGESSQTEGAYKGEGAKAGGRAAQEKIRKGEGGKGALHGRQCIIHDGPNKGQVDPRCKEYNPNLVGRDKLEEGNSRDVIHRNIDRLMHGDAGYEGAYLDSGTHGHTYSRAQAAAIAYKKAGMSGPGRGTATGNKTSRQKRIESHNTKLRGMDLTKRGQALKAIHEAHDQEGQARGSITQAVHKALIANPQASPEEIMGMLKAHESGDLTKTLHKEEIAHIMADKRFQTDVRNTGYKIRKFIQENKDASPEQIMQALEGQTGNLTPDEVNALIKSGGLVSGVSSLQGNQASATLEDVDDADSWIQNNIKNPGDPNMGPDDLIEQILEKNNIVEGKNGYDPSSYSPQQYQQVIAELKKANPEINESQLRSALKSAYGFAPPASSSSRPVRPETFKSGPISNKLRDTISQLRGMGTLRNQHRVAKKKLQNAGHYDAHNAFVKEQQAEAKRREMEKRQASAGSKGRKAPAPEAQQPPTTEAQSQGAQQPPENQGATPEAQATSPPRGRRGRTQKPPTEEAQQPPQEAQPPGDQSPESQGAQAPKGRREGAQKPPAPAAPTPVSDEDHHRMGRTLSDVIGKAKGNKALNGLAKKLGFDLNDLHSFLQEASRRAAPPNNPEGGTASSTPNVKTVTPEVVDNTPKTGQGVSGSNSGTGRGMKITDAMRGLQGEIEASNSRVGKALGDYIKGREEQVQGVVNQMQSTSWKALEDNGDNPAALLIERGTLKPEDLARVQERGMYVQPKHLKELVGSKTITRAQATELSAQAKQLQATAKTQQLPPSTDTSTANPPNNPQPKAAAGANANAKPPRKRGSKVSASNNPAPVPEGAAGGVKEGSSNKTPTTSKPARNSLTLKTPFYSYDKFMDQEEEGALTPSYKGNYTGYDDYFDNLGLLRAKQVKLDTTDYDTTTHLINDNKELQKYRVKGTSEYKVPPEEMDKVLQAASNVNEYTKLFKPEEIKEYYKAFNILPKEGDEETTSTADSPSNNAIDLMTKGNKKANEILEMMKDPENPLKVTDGDLRYLKDRGLIDQGMHRKMLHHTYKRGGAISASEYNFSAPYGWSFNEPTHSNIVGGEDANRNLIKIPDGWGVRG
jgi:hypothetical protein